LVEEFVPGSVIRERYRLLKKLGQGGMGSVWLAEDDELLRQVAVKLMAPAIAQDPVVARRFRTEAQAAAALRTKHVVQVLDFGLDDGQPFIVMEVLEGENLADRLGRVGRLAPADALTLLTQVGRAIGQAHALGIIHRDLKPANVFITRDDDTGEELVKVLDFGIAKEQTPRGKAPVLETSTGQILGTPYYMSPEQISLRARVDTRTDIWAFGVLTCEVLTGRRPFTAGTIEELTLVICSDPLPVPSRLATVPPGFDAWFAQAVARDPNERFESLETALGALRTALSEPERQAREEVRGADPNAETLAVTAAPASLTLGTSAPTRRAPWRARAAVAAGSLLVVGGLVVWGAARTSRGPSSGAERSTPITGRDTARPSDEGATSARVPAEPRPAVPIVVPKSPALAPGEQDRAAPPPPSAQRDDATAPGVAPRAGPKVSGSRKSPISPEELKRRQDEAKRRELAKRLGVAAKP
jgi:eukaryotic-like serine/threonine-protein kinase